jgi:hypothetical protein
VAKPELVLSVNFISMGTLNENSVKLLIFLLFYSVRYSCQIVLKRFVLKLLKNDVTINIFLYNLFLSSMFDR